jgi:hypothetical protein
MVDGSCAEPRSSHISHGESMYLMRVPALAYSMSRGVAARYVLRGGFLP